MQPGIQTLISPQAKMTTPKHSRVELLLPKDKRKILAAEKNTSCLWDNGKNNHRLFIRNNAG